MTSTTSFVSLLPSTTLHEDIITVRVTNVPSWIARRFGRNTSVWAVQYQGSGGSWFRLPDRIAADAQTTEFLRQCQQYAHHTIPLLATEVSVAAQSVQQIIDGTAQADAAVHSAEQAQADAQAASQKADALKAAAEAGKVAAYEKLTKALQKYGRVLATTGDIWELDSSGKPVSGKPADATTAMFDDAA